MNNEEAKDFLINISYKLGNMAVEYLTEKDGEKMREAIKALEQEPCDVFDEYGNYKYPSDVELTELNTATSMPCENAISRQASKDSEYKVIHFKEDVECLPPVHSQPNKEDIHREREQAYMRGYEDGGRKYRTEQSEDAISRSDMLDVIGHGTTYTSEDLQKIIKGMPPVNPQEPKTGHWIDSPNGYFTQCSECGLHGAIGIYKHYGWCPNCGARMIEPQETETWNGIHAQITAPKGTFERIFNDADDDNDI